MSKKAIKTTGDLREFLVTMMIGVKDGLVDGEDARHITKLASQINESFYSEIKIAKTRHEIAGEQFSALGNTQIGNTESPQV